MIYAYKDGIRKDNFVTVADGNERIGLVCPLPKGTILDLDWDESWLVVLAQEGPPADKKTDLVVYRMADLAEVARLKSVRFTREVMIIAGTDLIGVRLSDRVNAIYRLPDLSDAWQDLPTFLVNSDGDFRHFELPRADDESCITLGFPLFRRYDDTILGTIHESSMTERGKPRPAGLMEVDFKNRQLTPRIMEMPKGSPAPLKSPSPCGRYIMRAGRVPQYKGKLGQNKFLVWHRLGIEIDVFKTEDLSLYKRFEPGDVVATCTIQESDKRVKNVRRDRLCFGPGSIWPSCTMPTEFESGSTFGNPFWMPVWPGHSEAFYFRSDDSLRRIPMTGPPGPWIHDGVGEDHPVRDILVDQDRDLDIYWPSLRSGLSGLSTSLIVSVREVGDTLLISEWRSSSKLWLDDGMSLHDSDRIILTSENCDRIRPKSLELTDIETYLPCLSHLKSWKPGDVETCLEELTERLRSDFSDMITDRLEPLFQSDSAILSEREFFARIEEESIEIAPTVRRYVDTFLVMAKRHDHKPFDLEEPGAITPALEYLVAREDATDLMLRYLHQCDGIRSYHVRVVMLRDIVSKAWANELSEAPYYAVTEATAWLCTMDDSFMEDDRYVSSFEHFGVLEKCRTRVSPSEFAHLISLVASEFGLDVRALAEECSEFLGSSFWDRKTKQLLSKL